MELKATNHSYYCNDGNYFKANHQSVYETWEKFKEDWFFLNDNTDIDHDYNHCFRFDIVNQIDYETEEEIKDKFSLKLYFMLQRKGNFIPVEIKEITEKDMAEIEKYLKDCWDYLQCQWEEIKNL